MAKYGYIRVSSKDQNPDRQQEALKRYGVKSKNPEITILLFITGNSEAVVIRC